MDQYLTCLGSSALSDFRRKRLADRLGVTDVRARYVHYIALHGANGQDVAQNYNREDLDQLLAYGDQAVDDSTAGGEDTTLFVAPRLNTISPWSSEATVIARNCGFENIRRIERGIMVGITSQGHFDRTLAASLLHDPMTQTISSSIPDLEAMFAQGTPAPLQIIPLHENNKDPYETLQEANVSLGLALDASEINYLVNAFAPDGPVARDPSDAELFMFAQISRSSLRRSFSL